MSPSPLTRSADLRRLAEEGYRLELLGGQLVVRDVPFIARLGLRQLGSLVVPLELAGDRTVAPRHHGAFFAGGVPHDRLGHPLTAIGPAHRANLGPGLGEALALCMRPADREYRNYHELVTNFVAVISEPAGGWSAAGVGPASPTVPDTPFAYADTATARAGIGVEAATLEGQKVAIVGVGGTGSYLLDLLAKTPVAAIHLFDDDRMLQHNAFRAPGAPSAADLGRRPFKVDHFAATYLRMHRGVVAHRLRIDDRSVARLDDMDIVFLCLDEGPVRAFIALHLVERGIPFIDTGMGLERTDPGLVGAIRVTTALPGVSSHLGDAGRLPAEVARDDDPYASNIQVAELNALAAALAVLRWKRLRGFYADTEGEHLCVYAIDGNHLANERIGSQGVSPALAFAPGMSPPT